MLGDLERSFCRAKTRAVWSLICKRSWFSAQGGLGKVGRVRVASEHQPECQGPHGNLRPGESLGSAYKGKMIILLNVLLPRMEHSKVKASLLRAIFKRDLYPSNSAKMPRASAEMQTIMRAVRAFHKRGELC